MTSPAAETGQQLRHPCFQLTKTRLLGHSRLAHPDWTPTIPERLGKRCSLDLARSRPLLRRVFRHRGARSPPTFKIWTDRKLSPVQRDRSAELRSGFHMACCCSSHESNATCDVIHSQGSRLPMELTRWSIPCSFHVSQVKTASVLTSYKSPFIPNVFEYSSFLTILVSVPHLEANKRT